MNRCDQCKHARFVMKFVEIDGAPWNDDGAGHGTFFRVRLQLSRDDPRNPDGFSLTDGFGLTCSLALSDGGSSQGFTRAVAVDSEEFAAKLYVADDFGCVQWEEGQPSEDPR